MSRLCYATATAWFDGLTFSATLPGKVIRPIHLTFRWLEFRVSIAIFLLPLVRLLHLVTLLCDDAEVQAVALYGALDTQVSPTLFAVVLTYVFRSCYSRSSSQPS